MPQSTTDYLFESLPAIYRKEGRNGFVYRLLSLFGDALAEAEDIVDGIHNYLLPIRAPEGFLPWLASWVALVLDETWSVEKRRLLIREAVNLYKWRGTIKGLKTFVEIYTGMTPEVNEHFNSGWQIGVRSTIGEDTRIYDLAEDAH
jgi:phage tail-like protein